MNGVFALAYLALGAGALRGTESLGLDDPFQGPFRFSVGTFTTAHGMPGKSRRAVNATAMVVTSTSPTASAPIEAKFRLNSRTEVNIAADQRMGGRKTKKTRFGSKSGTTMPGRSVTRNPATTWRIGVGTGSRRASANNATTSAATAIAKTTGSRWGIRTKFGWVA